MSAQDAPDADLVRRLLVAQFPLWADLDLRAVASSGTDNAVFRLGDDLCVRLPKRESAASQAARDQRWLPRLAARLPLAIPEPVAAGSPGEGYPWDWSVCRWLPGEDASVAELDREHAASALGDFLRTLRSIDASGGPQAGTANHGRGLPLARLDQRVRRDVATLAGRLDDGAVLAIWDEALAAPVWGGPGAWVHGDLYPSNLLVREGRLVGVLDFGLLGVGDPACDLFVAWSLFDASSRRSFRKGLAVDDLTWVRGRGWAVFSSIITLAFYLEKNPALCAMAWRTVEQLLEEGT